MGQAGEVRRAAAHGAVYLAVYLLILRAALCSSRVIERLAHSSSSSSSSRHAVSCRSVRHFMAAVTAAAAPTCTVGAVQDITAVALRLCHDSG